MGHLFGGLRNRLVLNAHALRIRVVHLLVYSAPSLQVEHCLGFAGEHLSEYIYFKFKHTEFFTSHGGYLLNTTLEVPGVGFSVAGPDRAKFGFYQFQSFFGYCCHSDIDFY